MAGRKGERAVGVTITQVPGRMEVKVAWQQSGTASTTAVRLEALEAGFWHVVASVVPPAGATEVTFPPPAPVPPLRAGLTVRAVLVATVPAPEVRTRVPTTTLLSNELTLSIDPSKAVAVQLPDLPQGVLAPGVAEATRLAQRVGRTASTYRSKFLREQALLVATQAFDVESQVTALQAMDLGKLAAAQAVASPVLQQALAQALDVNQSLTNLPVPDLTEATAHLASAVSNLFLLQRIVDWLTRQSVLSFWYDLFGALIDDVAHVDTGLTRTSAYLRRVFGSTLADQIGELYDEVEAQVRGRAADLEGTVRTALAGALGGLNRQTAGLFNAFDAGLTAAPAATSAMAVPGPPRPDDVLDPNPLDKALDDVRKAVDEHLAKLRAELDKSLGMIDKTAAQELFVVVMTTYVVLPILGALAVALAGGPPAAALLAGAVLVGGQELVHLIAGWLAGPISAQLDALRNGVDEARRALEGLVAGSVASTVQHVQKLAAAERPLDLAGQFLRELSLLVPDAFLTATADALARQHDALLERASELALAAELSQGHEHATMFDAIRPDYAQLAGERLPAAAQLPGGTGATRHVAELLIADLHRLDEQRLELPDGKQMLLTRRVSVRQLLSTAVADPSDPAAVPASTLAPLTRLLRGEPVAVDLDEGDLLDSTHPGAYRALIDDVRVMAIVAGAVSPATSLPVLLHHTGPSRVRVRKPGGAGGGLGEQALNALLALPVVETAYRRAKAGAVAFAKTAPPNQKHVTWWDFFASALMEEWRSAAANADLPSLATREQALLDELWALGIPPGPSPAMLQRAPQDLAARLAIMLGKAFAGDPLPSLHPAAGVANRNPSDSEIRTWTTSLVAELRRRRHALLGETFSPLRKWGRQVRLEEESEPALRETGFLRLHRDAPPETLAVQLQPPVGTPPTPLGVAAMTTLVSPGVLDTPASSIPPEQFRPLENRGVTGRLVIQLPGALDDTTGLYDPATGLLQDLVLELDLRVCHDPELEAALRAARERSRTLHHMVEASGRGPVALPRATATADVAPGPRRTLQISVRAQRDRTLAAWKLAREAQRMRGLPDFDAAEKLTVAEVDNLQLLSRHDPLRPLAGNRSLRIRFGGPAPTALGDLAGTLVVQPEQLGLAGDLLPALAGLGSPQRGVVHAIGVAVVPAAKAPAKPKTQPRVRVGSALSSLVGRTNWAMRGVRMTNAADDVAGWVKTVDLARLFEQPDQSSIQLDFQDLLDNGAIYDVLVTVVYSPPVVRVFPRDMALL